MAQTTVNGLPQDSVSDPPVMPTAVMGTNDNCTVSKRSVEMLYYPKPHFYRYFVKRPKKRTALINRGYLLRMKAVEHRLNRFLDENKGNKAVINLGCGYDALPFRTMSEHAALTKDTTFVDVDYDTLIKEKIQIIRQNEELCGTLKGLSTESRQANVYLSSENYIALGCDLADPRPLQQFLTNYFTKDTSFLIISEVAITYMPVQTADAILSAFSHLKHAQFCLLEQCLPNGPNHPFASTMLKHFNKLSSPLRVIQQYQTISDQENRFLDRGWTSIDAQSLWKVWSGEEVFSTKEKIALRSKEIFDEHEEFALFANHYFILTAKSLGPRKAVDEQLIRFRPRSIDLLDKSQTGLRLRPRRDAVLYEAYNDVFVHHGGDDGRSRLASSQEYFGESKSESIHKPEKPDISARKHHTITKLNKEHSYLLVGGRDNPQMPLQDCWLRKNESWNRVEDLPVPLFRHSATSFEVQGDQADKLSCVIVFGGKTSHDKDSNAWYLWKEGQGWKQLEVDSDRVAPRFSTNLLYHHKIQAGVLFGGMLSSEVVSNQVFTWTVSNDKIYLTPLEITGENGVMSKACRSGAAIVQHEDCVVVTGGITESGLPGDVLKLYLKLDSAEPVPSIRVQSSNPTSFAVPQNYPQPMLVGHSAIVSGETLTIIGGGAICFSFGSFMNSTSWHIDLGKEPSAGWRTGLWKSPQIPLAENLMTGGRIMTEDSVQEDTEEHKRSITRSSEEGFITVKRMPSGTKDTLIKRMSKAKPCVFESVDIGPCITKWTPEYLKQALNSDRLLDIHHASTNTMLFESKNFQIRKQSFTDFMDDVLAGHKVYLRAVSLKDKHKPASFYEDFEAVAMDFTIPQHLAVANDLQHSSVLRISGPINMWLHYDTLSNILCQIRGSKRLILFSPADVAHLKIPPGRSSSDLNVFDAKAWETTSLRFTHPYEAILNPGDVLYIPPLWCHAALPLDDISIAVNTFFKTEDEQRYAHGQDTYGNKDISEYEYARNDVARMTSRFKLMSQDTRRFYLERLADEILQQARKKQQ